MRYNSAMRRLLLLLVMGAVAVFPPSLQAQRGRGAGGGVRAAPRFAAPARAYVAPSVRGGVRFAPGRFGRPFVASRFGPRRRFFINSGCFGYPYYCSGFYYPYSTLYYPPLFWPDTEYTQQPYPAAPQRYDDAALRAEVDRLANEVERLRQEQQARQAPQPARPAAEPATVLVFRDGHRSEVQNYGIVGETLWVFTERHARKYPLSELDLPATKAANDQRGVGFTVPEPPPTPRQPLKPMSPGMPSAVPDGPTVLRAAQQSAIWK